MLVWRARQTAALVRQHKAGEAWCLFLCGSTKQVRPGVCAGFMERNPCPSGASRFPNAVHVTRAVLALQLTRNASTQACRLACHQARCVEEHAASLHTTACAYMIIHSNAAYTLRCSAHHRLFTVCCWWARVH
jgi:hypothetical protein